MKFKLILRAASIAVVLSLLLCSCGGSEPEKKTSMVNNILDTLPVSSPESSSSSQENSSSQDSSSTDNDNTSGSTSASSSSSGSKASSSQAPISVKIVVPEGYTFMQIADLLEKNGVVKKKDFYTFCQSYSPKSFTIPKSSQRCFNLEGYLWPATYKFEKNSSAKDVAIKMLNTFRSNAGNVDDKTIILASMIEREARTDKNMKLVSSVFHNRLNNSSKYPYLDCDPTRDYVNNYITGNSLVSNQSKYAQYYNTYGKRKGLPAGPICSPSARAINAAKNPTKTDYYYFFFGKDNENHYSKTASEHNAQIKKIGLG